jgi:rare lipoprotein A
VRVEYVGRAPLEGSDDRMLMATLREGQPAPAPSMVMLASSKPFLPDMRQRLAVLRGPVPMPPDRPYTLGAPDERYATNDYSVSQRMAAETADLRLPERVETVEQVSFNEAPRAAPTVSAFAPPSALRLDTPSPVMSGRGLY